MATSKSQGLVSGAGWSTVSTLSSVLVPFLLFIVFARIASPAQVGLFAYGLAWVEMFKAIAPQGVYEAFLARRGEDDHLVARSLTTLLGLSGLAGYGAFGVIAWLHDVNDPAGRLALLALGLRVPFDLLTLQPQAVIAKRLDYRRMALRTLIANVLAGALGLAGAMTLSPLVGMATYYVLQSGLTFALTAGAKGAFAPPAVTAKTFQEGMRRLGGQPVSASFVRTVAAANNYLDQILVAAFVPLQALARFNIGKRVETILIQGSTTFSTILFQPLFAVQESETTKRSLQNTLVMFMALTGAPAAILLANHESAVATVFGARWASSSTIVAFLTLSGLARAMGSVHGAYLSVNSRNRELLVYAGASSVLGLTAVAGLAQVGIVWCAAALALKSCVMTGWVVWRTRAIVPLRFWLIRVAGLFVILLAGATGGAWLGESGAHMLALAPGVPTFAVRWGGSALLCLTAGAVLLRQLLGDVIGLVRRSGKAAE